MSRIRNQPDSYAPLFSTLSMTVAGVKTNIPTQQFLQGLTVDLVGQGSWKGTIELFDADGDYLENLIIGSGFDRQVEFQFGWDDLNSASLPVYRGSILKYTPTFSVEGIHLRAEVVVTPLLASVVDKRPLFFPANMTASAIFRQIAADRGWRTTDTAGNSTVEDTVGFLDSYAYRNESDINFVINRLLKQSVNERGEAFRFFFDSAGVVHFHSFKRGGDGNEYDLAAEYIYTADSRGEVIHFAPTDNSFEAALTGGGNANFWGVDSLGGSSLQRTASSLGGVTNESAQTVVGDAAFKTDIAPGKENSRTFVQTRDINELARLSASRWSSLANVAYQASLDVRGTHAVDPYDFIKVRYIKKDGSDHYMSGVFQVGSVTHHFGLQGFTTSMALLRMGTRQITGASQIEATTKAAAVVTSDTQSSVNGPSGVPGETTRSTPIRKGS